MGRVRRPAPPLLGCAWAAGRPGPKSSVGSGGRPMKSSPPPLPLYWFKLYLSLARANTRPLSVSLGAPLARPKAQDGYSNII